MLLSIILLTLSAIGCAILMKEAWDNPTWIAGRTEVYIILIGFGVMLLLISIQ